MPRSKRVAPTTSRPARSAWASASARRAPGELRFDMFEAELTHIGDRCTFEVLLARMGPGDPALAAIGELVHDLDLREDKFGRPEAAATPLLDRLHATFASRVRRAERAR